MNTWFIPKPEEFPSQRALLHLGLNKAVRYYRELIVPGIGGTQFVRQFSWAVASLTLSENKKKYNSAKIANSIEALACKLEWKHKKEEYNGKGKLAFSKDDGKNIWSFKDLSSEQHYVQVTYRMSTVRALAGLGLTTGMRFNSMELTEAGNALSETFLNQKNGSNSLKNTLENWIEKGKSFPKTGNIIQRLNKIDALNKEKEIIRNCLMADSAGKLGNPQRRQFLISTFSRYKVNMPEINVIKKKLNEHKDYVNDIETALAFDEMIECGRRIIHKCAELIDSKSKLAGNDELNNKLKELCTKIKAYQNTKGEKHTDADAFTNLIQEKDNAKLLKNIIARDGNILTLSNDNIIKGHLFGRHKEIKTNNKNSTTQDNPEEFSTERKIHQLFELWRDCN